MAFLSILSIILLQVLMGFGMLAHGAPKFRNLSRVARDFARMGYSESLAYVVAWVEVVTSIMIILGVFARLAAGVLSFLMLGAMFHHWKDRDPFKGGWEPAFLYFICCLVILLSGFSWIGF